MKMEKKKTRQNRNKKTKLHKTCKKVGGDLPIYQQRYPIQQPQQRYPIQQPQQRYPIQQPANDGGLAIVMFGLGIVGVIGLYAGFSK